MDEPELTPPVQPPLRRRNSIATSVVTPTLLTLPSKPLHSSSLPNGSLNGVASAVLPEFELASYRSSLSYTSLKDVLPSTAVNSPSAALSTCGSAYEISIRNRLVKQAAWAYLQPMSSSPSASTENFFSRVWIRLSESNPLGACIRFISLYVIPCISGAFDWIIRQAFRVRSNR